MNTMHSIMIFGKNATKWMFVELFRNRSVDYSSDKHRGLWEMAEFTLRYVFEKASIIL